MLAAVCMTMLALAQAPSLEPKQDAKKPLWGFVNPQNSKWVVKPTYNVVNPFEEGPDGKYRALVQKGTMQGWLGVDGKPLGAGIVFENIEPLMQGNNMLVTVKGKKGIINLDGVYQLKPEFTEVSPLGNEGYLVTLKGKKGFLSPSGEMKVQPLYDDIATTVPDYFIVSKGGKAGIVSRSGQLVLEPGEYNSVSPIAGDRWKVVKGDKSGMYNVATRTLEVKPEYKIVGYPLEMPGNIIYPVCKTNGKWGAVNSMGKEVIKCKNQEMVPVPQLKAIMVRRNAVGHRLYLPEYDVFLELDAFNTTKAGPFNVVMGIVSKPSRNVPAGISGLSIGEMGAYEGTYSTRERAYNALGNRDFVIVTDADGNLISNNPNFGMTELGNLYLVRPSKKDTWKIYSKDGKLLHSSKDSGDMNWSSEEGWVATDNTIFYPDGTTYDFLPVGTELAFRRTDSSQPWTRLVNDRPDPTQLFDEVIVTPGDTHTAAVRRDGKWGVLVDGTTKLECKFPSPVRSLDEQTDYFLVGNVGKTGLMDKGGNVVIPMEYDSITESYRKGCYVVYAPTTNGLYDLDNKSWIIPMGKYSDWNFINTKDVPYEQKYFWIYDHNDNVGIADPQGKEILSPSKGSKAGDNNTTFYYSDKYITVVKNGKTYYYNFNGTAFTPTPKGWLDDESREGDRTYGGHKGEMQWVDVHFRYLNGHKIKLICQVYNANGTPHVSRGGEHIKKVYEWDIDGDDQVVDDQVFFVRYDFISQPRYTSRDYYVKYTLIDVTTGRTLATTKIKFGMQRG